VKLLDDEELERSAIVANCRMNRERNLAGIWALGPGGSSWFWLHLRPATTIWSDVESSHARRVTDTLRRHPLFGVCHQRVPLITPEHLSQAPARGSGEE
jgi:hypothetical protein